MTNPRKLYVLVGEDSGDLHASKVLAALEKQGGWDCRGMGGDKMIAQGFRAIAHVRDINFMGFFEVVQNLGTIRELFKIVKKDMSDWKPDAVLLVDYPGFNLRMAKYIKETLGIPVLYYISPQLWAWKKGRIKSIRAYVDRMMVILPFEVPFYKGEDVEADFVGHPLLDVIDTQKSREPVSGRVALLPGSRKQEITRMLPVMLEAAKQFPEKEFVVAGAPSQTPSFYEKLMAGSEATLWENQTYELLDTAEIAVVTSGTATLETALHGVPEVVVYKAHPISYIIGKRLMQVDHMSLVNLVLDRRAVPELLQGIFTADDVANALRDLDKAETRQVMSADYEELYRALGDAGAAERVAKIISETV